LNIRLGIPSSLFYYVYFPMWRVFFKELGVEIIISGQTTKTLLDQGVKEAVADACVPVKVYFGHTLSLKDKVDFLFIPRIVSVNNKTIFCPKFLGLPDMVRHGLSNMPPIIDVEIDSRKGWFSLLKAYMKVGLMFNKNKLKIIIAYLKSMNEHKYYLKLLRKGLHPSQYIDYINDGTALVFPDEEKTPDFVFAVLGYPYEVHDYYVSSGLVNKLQEMGVKVITIENICLKKTSLSGKLEKRMFWTFSDTVLNAAYYLFEQNNIDGMIHLTAFGCGPDSMVDTLMEIASRDYPEIPYMSITIDEHTGDAGIATRLEAFYDMVKRKKEAG
jgi:predicted nucleotide-binding protein (sugar kinase/HSP70/actin superfamily)